jgi:hypothetical protein
MAKMIVQRVDVLSVASTWAIVGLFVGLLSAVLGIAGVLLGRQLADAVEVGALVPAELDAAFYARSVLVPPTTGLIGGFLWGLAIGLFYNVAAKLTGGVRAEVEIQVHRREVHAEPVVFDFEAYMRRQPPPTFEEQPPSA